MKLKIIFFLTITLVCVNNFAAQPPSNLSQDQCNARLCCLIEKKEIAQVHEQLRHCMQYGSTDEQFKNAKAWAVRNNKTELIEKIQQAQFEVNSQNEQNVITTASHEKSSLWKYVLGALGSLTVVTWIITKIQGFERPGLDTDQDQQKRKKLKTN